MGNERMLSGRYKRLRDVPDYKLVRRVSPDGKVYNPTVLPVMDRGMLNVAVRAYAHVHDMSYELAHWRLSEQPSISTP